VEKIFLYTSICLPPQELFIECNVLNLMKKKEFLYIFFRKKRWKKKCDLNQRNIFLQLNEFFKFVNEVYDPI
tara:strand:- start:266 stop:481 length:216 start_codon:yes stop_codon:yes gene_type:complete